MTVTKTISSKSPYIGRTFQGAANKTLGRSGYVSGGATSDNGSTVTVQPLTFVQNGLYVSDDAAIAGTAVPTGAEPWFVLASTTNDDPDSGLTLMVTDDLGVAAVGILVAYKTNGVWRNPAGLSIRSREDEVVVDAGRDNGFTVRPTLSGANVATFEVSQGELVDPDGRRRLLQDAAVSMDAESITPVTPHETMNRTDYLVLRQREDYTSELAYLVGATVPDKHSMLDEVTESLDAGGVTGRPHYYAKRGGTAAQEWWVWKRGTTLWFQADRADAGNGIAITPVDSVGTITDVQIVGQRAADDAILVMYIANGNTLRLIALNDDGATATGIDAAVTINTVANTITHCRGVLDHNEELHIVYQHDVLGTALDEQVYYTRRTTVTGATFGDQSIAQNFVDGSNSGKNDTGPDIDIDRHGVAHIVYITGTAGSANEFGELRYTTIDQMGTRTFQKTYSNSGDIGQDVDINDDIPIALYTTVSNVRFASVTVTPHDEVNAIVAGEDSGDAGLFKKVFLFNPDFEARLGFAMMDILVGDGEIKECSIASDEQGGLYLAHVLDGGATDSIGIARTDTVFAPNGRVGRSLLSNGRFIADTMSPFTGEMFIEFGHSGAFEVMYEASTIVKTVAITANASGIATTFSNVPSPHPKDIYLASWFVPGEATPVLPESAVHLVNIRPRKMNYPFLVGDNGDFHGYNALSDAIRAGNRGGIDGGGGEIVIRSGHHRLNTRLDLRTPIRISGEGLAVLEWVGLTEDRFLIGNGSAGIAVSAISGQVITIDAVQASRTSSGDLVNMATSGFHRVVRVINDKVVLDGVAPVGATVDRYPAGASFENLTFMSTGDSITNYIIKVDRANKVRISNCAFRTDPGTVASGAIAVLFETSRDCLIENCDFSAWTSNPNGVAIKMQGGFQNTVDGCLLQPLSAMIEIATSEFEPRLSNCGTLSGLAGFGTVYDIKTTRTDPVHMVNCLGGITPSADLDGSVTFVGESIHADATLSFSDGNTAASSDARPVPFSDSGSDWLPDSGHAYPITSILHGHSSYLNNQAQYIGEGVYSGVAPTEGAWPLVNFALGTIAFNGRFGSVSATSHAGGGEVADTDYFFYVDPNGVVTRTTSFDPDNNTDGVLIAFARTNVTPNAWATFVDMRKFADRAADKGPVIVSPNQDGATAHRGHVTTVEAALQWIRWLGPDGDSRESVSEIIITDEIDITSSIVVDLDQVGGVTIRGAGRNAGFRSNTDNSFFTIKGGAADVDYNKTFRLSNLNLLANKATGYTSDTGYIEFEVGDGGGFFGDVYIDRVQTDSLTINRPDLGIAFRASITGGGQWFIEKNNIDGFDDVGIAWDSGQSDVYIRDNRIAGQDIANSIALRVNTGTVGFWAIGNSLSSCDLGIEVQAGSGIWIVDNDIIADTNAAKAVTFPNIAIHNDCVISGNHFAGGAIDFWDMGVFINAPSEAYNARIVDNIFDYCLEGIEFQPTAGSAVVANNCFEMCGGTGGNGQVVRVTNNAIVDGNVVLCDQPLVGIEIGQFSCASNNIVKGQCRSAIKNTNFNGAVISGNSIDLTHGAGFRNGIQTGNGRVSISGNSISTSKVGIDVTINNVGSVVSSNQIVITNGNGLVAGNRAILIQGESVALIGNHCFHQGDNGGDDTDGLIELTNDGSNHVLVGNHVSETNQADNDSTTGAEGMSALRSEAPGSVIVGNYFQNKGNHTTKATVTFPGTAASHLNCVMVGNVINNKASSGADHIEITTGPSIEMGTSSIAEPGTNIRA